MRNKSFLIYSQIHSFSTAILIGIELIILLLFTPYSFLTNSQKSTGIVNKNDPNDKYTLLDTHGIIFNLEDDYQIAFEKDDFGENITIYRGYNLQDKFKNIPNDITSTIIDEYEATCYLEYTSIE